MIGQTLAHYKILEKIGSGGMGDVYLAEDTKLDRKVALKVLPPELAESEERRARFQREAKAIAALNHPNIVHVYSVEEAGGVHFITMELVKGKTLAELLPTKGFSLEKFFDIAIPLADAVVAAHDAGIIHRDLKPGNVMVTDDGRVKVLDFGLARPEPPIQANIDSESPTEFKTREGTLTGTLHYMSPEQVQGKHLDARSDIFSLGVVLYEMLAGNRPFVGDNPAGVLSSIIKDTPTNVSDTRREIPRHLSRLVQHCMEKEPGARPQSALALRRDIEEIKSAQISTGYRIMGLRGGRFPTIPVAGGLFLVGLITTLWLFRGASDVAGPRLDDPIQVTSAIGVEDHATWSPDTGRLAYESNRSGRWDIWISQIGTGEAVNLTEDHGDENRFPSWSPDGRQIAFLAQEGSGWGLYTIPAIGGSPRKIISIALDAYATSAPSWSPDGEQIALLTRESAHNYVEIVSWEMNDSERLPLPHHEGNRCFDLAWSPDGRHFAYVEAVSYTAEATQLWIVPSAGGPSTPVTDGRSNVWSPSWLPDGHQLFFVSNFGGSMDLWRQHIGDAAEVIGEPERITVGLGMRSASFSSDGRKFVYSRGRRVSNIWRVPVSRNRRATWADAEQRSFDSAFIEAIDASPDGRTLVLSSDRAGNQDLWTLSIDGGSMKPLTTGPFIDSAPRWSPDGNEIAFLSNRRGNRDIWIVPAAGGTPLQITTDPAEDSVPTWSPDGGLIAFASRRSGNRDIWLIDRNSGETRQVTTHTASDFWPTWSPDGKSIVFQSLRSGEPRFWRKDLVGGEPTRISEGAGFWPSWSAEREAFFFAGWKEQTGNIWAISQDGREYPATDFVGRRGELGWGLASHGKYIFFTWWENVGDIWVMDVVTDDDS